jgi:subfamily B ATP-binding cassette protein HlyB/CyaB
VQDPGLDALIIIARYHNIAADAQQLRHAAALKSERLG